MHESMIEVYLLKFSWARTDMPKDSLKMFCLYKARYDLVE